MIAPRNFSTTSCMIFYAGLEIMSKVCLVSVNESPLAKRLDVDAYRRLVELLTVQDIQLIVHTLEALYKLSKVGEPFTTQIANVHRAIGKYVSYLFEFFYLLIQTTF